MYELKAGKICYLLYASEKFLSLIRLAGVTNGKIRDSPRRREPS